MLKIILVLLLVVSSLKTQSFESSMITKDPNNNWIVTFTPQRQGTDISVHNIKTGQNLVEDYEKENLPDWYNNAHSAYFTPGKWNGNTLSINVVATIRPSGEDKYATFNLTIDDKSFIINP